MGLLKDGCLLKRERKCAMRCKLTKCENKLS